MTSAIAILTYRRLHALQTMMSGLETHCKQYPTSIFEDCGQRDDTSKWCQVGRRPEPRPELMATEYVDDGTLEQPSNPILRNVRYFSGDRNLGVAGNSNRAIKTFMDSGAEHLCLCNDDLHVDGDFVKFYAQAHADLGVGMFCFSDFTHHPSYKWISHRWRGYALKIMPRITGIMVSVTRELLEKIGYFDAEFRQFGQEHVDFTHRARMAGGIKCEGQDVGCLDVEHKLLRHQDVQTSVVGAVRARADAEADAIMNRCSHEYKFRHYYRPFKLTMPIMANGYYGAGIPCRQLEQIGYNVLTSLSS